MVHQYVIDQIIMNNVIQLVHMLRVIQLILVILDVVQLIKELYKYIVILAKNVLEAII